ncbi:MAG: ankyrin repeat domain-containing protein [Bryobacteraceae bacterium]
MEMASQKRSPDELFDCIATGDLQRFEQLLTAAPELIGARNQNGDSPLIAAAYRGRTEMVDWLLQAGAPLTIFEASAIGDLDRVRALASNDPASIHLYSHDGFTPLSLACFFGRRDVAEFLLGSGADVHAAARNPMRVTPLHAAVAGRHAEIAEALLAGGAEVNARQQAGYTPLHTAAGNGQKEMVRLLLAHGADASMRSDDGRSPRDMAEARGHHPVVQMLSEGQET